MWQVSERPGVHWIRQASPRSQVRSVGQSEKPPEMRLSGEIQLSGLKDTLSALPLSPPPCQEDLRCASWGDQNPSILLATFGDCTSENPHHLWLQMTSEVDDPLQLYKLYHTYRRGGSPWKARPYFKRVDAAIVKHLGQPTLEASLCQATPLPHV